MKGGHTGQGGYGGDIAVECLSPKGSSSRTEIPYAGTDTRRKPLTNIRMGVYEASGSNGKTGKMTGDVAFIHEVGQINCEIFSVPASSGCKSIPQEDSPYHSWV